MILPAYNRFSYWEYDYIRRVALLAKQLHAGQTRKFTGEPYYTHPFTVAEAVYNAGGTLDQVAAAYLHDTVEDCFPDVTPERAMDALAALGVRFETLQIVDLLTRRHNETAGDFILRAASDIRSNLVKEEDVNHNTSNLAEGESLWGRYLHFKAVLAEERRKLTGGTTRTTV